MALIETQIPAGLQGTKELTEALKVAMNVIHNAQVHVGADVTSTPPQNYKKVTNIYYDPATERMVVTYTSG